MADAHRRQNHNIYGRETSGISVVIRVIFLEDQSQPDKRHYVWAYQVRIENVGSVTMQLMRRTWIITNAAGHVQQIEGAGVVGEQPVLDPGDSFEYTSGTPLDTPSGFMTGVFHMIATDSGEEFDIPTPAFSLDSPYANLILH